MVNHFLTAAAIATNDVVIIEFGYFVPHPARSQVKPEENLHHVRKEVEHNAHPYENPKNCVNATVRTEGMTLAIAHGSQGDDGHKETVEKVPLLNQHKAKGTSQDKAHQADYIDCKTLSKRFFHRTPQS